MFNMRVDIYRTGISQESAQKNVLTAIETISVINSDSALFSMAQW